MSDRDDQALLRDYIENASEGAFAALVERYVDLVYSAAYRMTNNAELAQEVTQSVFAALSASAIRLETRRTLSGWLYRTAQNLAAKTVRTEVRRRAREQQAAAMNELLQSEPGSVWEQIAPNLDAALGSLRPKDRDVVLLRYFQRRSAREIAHTLGLSEEAAQKRVARALGRLRTALAARHVIVSAPLLASALVAHSVQAAPAGVAALALAGASGPASATTGTLAASLEFLGVTQPQVALLGLCFVIGLATPVLVDLGKERGTLAESATLAGRELASAEALRNQRTGQVPDGDLQPQWSAALDRLEAWLRKAATHTRGPVIYGDYLDDGEMRFLIWSLPASDYPEAWRMRERLDSREMVDRFQHALLESWAELDPPSALAAAMTLMGHWGRLDPAIRVLSTWAEKEPAAALSWVRNSVPDAQRPRVMAGVIPKVARCDPAAALAAIEELPPGRERREAFIETMLNWAGQEPDVAAGYVAGLPPSKTRGDLLETVARAWALTDPSAAFRWAETLPLDSERAEAFEGAMRGLAETRPTEAAALVTQLAETGNPIVPYQLEPIIRNWPGDDLASAATWLAQLPGGIDHDWAMRNLLERWVGRNPRLAAEFLKSLPVEKSQSEFVVPVLSAWAQSDLPGALDWMNGLSEGTLRGAAVKGLCAGWAETNPLEAATFAANLTPGEFQTEAAVVVADCWARQDVVAAAEWVGSFPEGEALEEGAKAILSIWAAPWPGLDLSEAEQWLQTLPAGHSRDGAAEFFIRQMCDREPALAAPWVSAISDQGERDRLIETMARTWRTTDPEACRVWLETLKLPEEKYRQIGDR